MSAALLCRLGLHDWRIISISLDGHQSDRTRRCDRCFDHGRLFCQTQARGYFGGSIGAPWVTTDDEQGEIIDGRFVAASPSPETDER